MARGPMMWAVEMCGPMVWAVEVCGTWRSARGMALGGRSVMRGATPPEARPIGAVGAAGSSATVGAGAPSSNVGGGELRVSVMVLLNPGFMGKKMSK